MILKAINVNPGAPELTISKYEWGIDGIISGDNTDTLIINSLSAVPHEISLRIQNSCGSWSNIYRQIINNIIGDKMEKTITLVVDQPAVPAKIVLDFTGTVEITVTNQLDKPIEGVSINLDDTPTDLITGSDGKVSIPNVPYGTHTIKGIK